MSLVRDRDPFWMAEVPFNISLLSEKLGYLNDRAQCKGIWNSKQQKSSEKNQRVLRLMLRSILGKPKENACNKKINVKKSETNTYARA
jgi:hypothetical protein